MRSSETGAQLSQPPLVRLREVMLRVEGWCCLDAVSMDVHQGERLALVGAPGCGATWVLRCLAACDTDLRASCRTGRIDGRRSSGLPARRWIGSGPAAGQAAALRASLDAELLLIDEDDPADPPSERAARDAPLRACAPPSTAVLVLTDPARATRIADRIAYFWDGRLLDIGPPDLVRSRGMDPGCAAFLSGG